MLVLFKTTAADVAVMLGHTIVSLNNSPFIRSYSTAMR